MAGYTGSIADAGRVIHIAKRRERAKEDIQREKRRIAAENAVRQIGDKFAAHADAVEQQLKSTTVGLVTLEEMKAKRDFAVKEREKQLAHRILEEGLGKEEKLKDSKRSKVEQKARLSFNPDFGDDDDEEGDADAREETNLKRKCESSAKADEVEDSGSAAGSSQTKLKKITKDPTVDTSFLPDAEREEEENRLREQLRQEWSERQERLKNEDIVVAFSYWDGSGHRRDVKMKKGHSIHQFLTTALDTLRKDFAELKVVSADSLMFVKEDLIIPSFYTFYDFIVTKAMGKTGPLFQFEAAAELRIRQDATVEGAESHPAKVVLRSWYERNKHIYPASRWEPFDPNKRYDNRTTSDDLKPL